MTMMTLSEAAKRFKQEGLAVKLGCTQGAIHQALLHKRSVYVIEDGEKYSAVEVKNAFNTEFDTKKIKVSL